MLLDWMVHIYIYLFREKKIGFNLNLKKFIPKYLYFHICLSALRRFFIFFLPILITCIHFDAMLYWYLYEIVRKYLIFASKHTALDVKNLKINESQFATHCYYREKNNKERIISLIFGVSFATKRKVLPQYHI